jgi:hypothetical protein
MLPNSNKNWQLKDIHKVIQESGFDCARNPTFATVCIGRASQHDLLRRRFTVANLGRWLCQKPILESLCVYWQMC